MLEDIVTNLTCLHVTPVNMDTLPRIYKSCREYFEATSVSVNRWSAFLIIWIHVDFSLLCILLLELMLLCSVSIPY